MPVIRPVLLALLAFTLFVTTTEAAPVTRTVGERFEITTQYVHEPAILGDTNGVKVTIKENGEPVTGIAADITVQVEYMEAVRVLNMYEDPAQPGVYTGVFIPMQPGEYSFGITGTIDGVEINETYTVNDGIVAVTPRTDYEFPNAAHGFGIQELALPIAATALIGGAWLIHTKRQSTLSR